MSEYIARFTSLMMIMVVLHVSVRIIHSACIPASTVLKIELWSRARIATLTFIRSCAPCITIFSTGRKFRPVSIFTLLHALTLVARFYALLSVPIVQQPAFSQLRESSYALLLYTYVRTDEVM